MKINLKFLYILFLGSISLVFLMAFITNVSTEVTNDDIIALKELGVNEIINHRRINSYADEIKEIKEVQNLVLNRIKSGKGIPEFENREPIDLLRVGEGLCYDRSRMLEKIYKYLGYEVRHVYISFLQDKSPLAALLTYRQPSHAVTELKTSRGWLLVDSNHPFISLDEQGNPLTADKLWEKDNFKDDIPDFYKSKYLAIRGLYSRKGFFYFPRLPFPELNWPDFLRWMVEG